MWQICIWYAKNCFNIWYPVLWSHFCFLSSAEFRPPSFNYLGWALERLITSPAGHSQRSGLVFRRGAFFPQPLLTLAKSSQTRKAGLRPLNIRLRDANVNFCRKSFHRSYMMGNDSSKTPEMLKIALYTSRHFLNSNMLSGSEIRYRSRMIGMFGILPLNNWAHSIHLAKPAASMRTSIPASVATDLVLFYPSSWALCHGRPCVV